MSIKIRSLSVALGLAVLLSASPAFSYVTMAPECGGAHWSSGYQPLPYYINSTGYSQIPFATVQQIIQEGFAVWSAPCCSAWSTTYMGTTAQVVGGAANTIGIFYESNWPSTLGQLSQTIGVTPLEIWSDCSIHSADIAYNAVTFRFVNRSPTGWNEADFKSITVHEMGHVLGLDHSNANGATMLPYYSNGIAERDLSQDDINGVCYLYNKSCTCTSNSQCATGETCVDGQCGAPPCTSNSCTGTQVCNTTTGVCEAPRCTTAADCPTNYACTSGTCYPAGSCNICKPCTSNTDCGAAGFCAGVDATTSVCSQMCPSGTCPGNSACFGVQADGQTYNICLNLDADTAGLCPASYVCNDGTTTPTGCPGLGTSCANNGASCNPANDVCLSDGGDGFCSCSCTLDSHCGTGNTCVDLQGGGKACVVGVVSPCDGVTCPAGQSCDPNNGQCITLTGCPGLGSSCANNGANCSPANDVCLTDASGQNPICSCGCTTNADCGLGVCVPVGDGSQSACIPNPCDGVSCPNGQLCDIYTGNCLGGPDVGPTDVSTDTSVPTDTSIPTDTNTSVDATVANDTGTTLIDGTSSVDGTSQADVNLVDSGGTKDDGCSCSVQTTPRSAWPTWAAFGALFGLLFLRRRRS